MTTTTRTALEAARSPGKAIAAPPAPPRPPRPSQPPQGATQQPVRIAVALGTVATFAALVAPVALGGTRPVAFWGNLAGAQYCRLRSAGVGRRESLLTAIRENRAPYRIAPVVTIAGRRLSVDVVEMGSYINNYCPRFGDAEGAL